MTKEKNYWIGFLPFVISTVVITLLGMITSVGTPFITNAFGLTSRQAPWITTLNTMSSAILAPLMGWLGDKRGVKTQLVAGIVCVMISNVICALAPNFIIFCIGRFINGIGLASAHPASMSYIAEYFPDNKKVGTFAILGACICLGSGLGPTIIGVLLSLCSWRSLFLYSEIVAVIILVYVVLIVKSEKKQVSARRLDGIGMLTLFIGIGALLSLLTLSTQYGWSHPMILGLLAVSIAALVLFYRHETHCKAPLMVVSLFRNSRFMIPAMMGLYIYAVKCYCSTAIPYFFSIGLGKPSSLSGYWLTVYFLAGFPLSFFVGRINRKFNTRTMAIFGVSTWLAGMVIFAFTDGNTAMWIFFVAAVIPSIGIALLGGMPNACALRGVPTDKTGSVSGMVSLMSNLGAAMISALVVPYLSVFGANADGTPNYVASFSKVALIMIALLIICLILTFFFPKDKGETVYS